MNSARLTADEQRFLRSLARLAVQAAVKGERPPDAHALAAAAGLPLEPRLTARRGAFVTLTSGGRLRGCIGYIEGVKPLIDAVADNGRSAAVRDPRFPAVTPEELDDLDLEISALTPLVEVAGPDDIVIGRHGVCLAKGGRQAVFLPQVAPVQGWDRDTTLTQLALKAGLGPDGWRQGAEFRVFEAHVF